MRALRALPVLLLVALCACTVNGEDASPKPERIPELVKHLESEEFETRENASKALLALGKPALADLRKARDKATEAESKRRLAEIVEALDAPLEFTAEVEGEAQAGKEVTFRVRIKNVSDRDVTVVGCLDGSTSDKRYPHFGRSITPDKPQAMMMGCGNCNSLRDSDLKVLKPGESFDPFGPGSFGEWQAKWTPDKEGAYTVKFTCDYAAKDLSEWNGPVERSMGLGGLEEKLKQVPKVALTASVELKVKP
ncbi:MAG: hypothetical protein L6R28_14065 [Planctomycetes bacterium]|nr:hypothetical protein [Planctomycetota bacterium]